MKEKNDKENLRLCPFCGGKAEINLFCGNYCVTCTNCMGAIFPARGVTRKEAINAWNRRYQSAINQRRQAQNLKGGRTE